MIKNVLWSSRKVPLVLMKLEFSRQIFEKTQVSNFMKIRPREKSCSMRTDGQTNMKKLIVIFLNVGKVPKNGRCSPILDIDN
jgi:hypothetical protein